MIPEQARSEIVRKRQLGMTWTGITRWLAEEYGVEVHRTTVQRWYDREIFSEEIADAVHDLDGSDRIKLDKKLQTFKTEAVYWKKLYEQSIKNQVKNEVFEDSIRTLAPAIRSVAIPKPKKVSGQGREQTMVAPLSDTHVGDKVEIDQMVGLNEYSIDIFNERLYGWANQLLQLVELRRKASPINKLIIPMLGDMISGDIHEELARTNIDNCMGQMIRGANLIAQALMFFAPHFSEIEVPCVVGNHGRMTRKPPMKDKFMDWDYMLYQWVATFCRDQKNIKFHIPKSYATTFDVYDRKVLIMHGDAISGAGSGTAIQNNITKMRSVFEYQRALREELGVAGNLPDNFDSVMIGHFHRVDEIDIGTGEIHICGTMKGGDEFALQRLTAITRPKQIATYWHPQYGCIGKEVLYLNRYDNSGDKFVDVLPELWVNN